MHPDKFFIALDGMSRKEAISLTKKLTHSQYAHSIAGFKIHDLWDRYGPGIVKELKKAGAKVVWLDIKLHDTPNTIALRAQAAKQAGVNMISIHASSGDRGLRAAALSGLKVIAVSILTSLTARDVTHIYRSSPEGAVLRLFLLAKNTGIWGLVCSSQELKFLPKQRAVRFVVPGIQLKKRPGANQKRTGTPNEALRSGADYLVLGSAVTKTSNPIAAFERLVAATLGEAQKQGA